MTKNWLHGDGQVSKFSSYDQWEEAREIEAAALNSERKKPEKGQSGVGTLSMAEKKLTYAEEKEWSTIETKISSAEKEVGKIQEILEIPENTASPQQLTKLCNDLAQAQAQEKIATLYARWEELELRQAEINGGG